MAIRVAAINTYRMYIEPGSTSGEPEPAGRQSNRRSASGDRRKARSDRRRGDENTVERVTAELRKLFLFEHLPPEAGSAENNVGEIPGISGETFDARL